MTIQSEQRNQVAPKVYVKQSWDWDFSTWTEIPDASFIKCQKSLGSSIPSASFRTRRGDMWIKGDTTSGFTSQGTDATAHLGYWVLIEADFDGDDTNNFQWVGVITDVQASYRGESVVDYDVNCLGPEYLLTKVQVTEAKVDRTGTRFTIARPVAFNRWVSTAKGRDILKGNFNGELSKGDYAFEADPDNENIWTANDVIDYLLENHAPTSTPVWDLDNTEVGMFDSLNFPQPSIETEGRTLFELINQVITRRRGLVWSVVLEFDKFRIRPRTVTPSNVVLTSGDTIAANPVTHNIDYHAEQEVINFRVTNSVKRRYQRVRVRGARKGIIGTFRVNTELEKTWLAGDETTYASGASGKAGYGALLVGEKAAANDSERLTEKLETVYTTYEVKPTWDGELDGETAVDPSVNWIERMRFENYLPLLRGYDYSADPAAPTGTPENEFIRPLIIIEDNAAGDFLYVDRLSSLSFFEGHGDGINFSCAVRVMNDRMGLKVMPTTVPHVIAGGGDYDVGTAEPSEYEPWLDWKTIQATLYFKVDEYCEAFAPTGPVVPIHDQVAELIIDIGDRARWDVVLNKTVLGVEEGSLIKASQEGAIRDDRELCETLAEAALVMYGNEYNAIQYTLGTLDESIKVGDMIADFADDSTTIDTNTIVSQISWDFENNTTQVVTEQFELDVFSL